MLIAKIETQQGIDNAAKILDVADGIMVARGDLGYAIPMERVPHVQKELIVLARSKNKPVITATQMLESMGNASVPTRAEITDVANAVMDGTSAVMLSQETSKGKYPFEAIRIMARIARGAEPYIPVTELPEENEVYDAIATSAVSVAEHLSVEFIAAFTESGATARRVCRHRPNCPVLGLTPTIDIARRLCFSWGVLPFVTPFLKKFEDMEELAKKMALSGEFKAKKGDMAVIVAGVPFGKGGSTNILHVITI
jgi:pyruvate kinase